jgi:hypothetical protein
VEGSRDYVPRVAKDEHGFTSETKYLTLIPAVLIKRPLADFGAVAKVGLDGLIGISTIALRTFREQGG